MTVALVCVPTAVRRPIDVLFGSLNVFPFNVTSKLKSKVGVCAGAKPVPSAPRIKVAKQTRKIAFTNAPSPQQRWLYGPAEAIGWLERNTHRAQACWKTARADSWLGNEKPAQNWCYRKWKGLWA